MVSLHCRLCTRKGCNVFPWPDAAAAILVRAGRHIANNGLVRRRSLTGDRDLDGGGGADRGERAGAGAGTVGVAARARALMRQSPSGWQNAGDPDGWSTLWTSEILPAAKDAITEVEIGRATHANSDRAPKCTWPVTLDSDYTKSANETAKSQLAKAGYRLAALLVAIFEAVPR
jgi:hypothetical protein